MKPTRKMVEERLKGLEGQGTKVAVLEAWDALERIEGALQSALYAPVQSECLTLIDVALAKIYRALGGDA